MKLCIATPKLRKNDGEGRVNLEIALEALRRGHSLRCLTGELDERLAQHPGVTWHRLNIAWLPTQLLRSIVWIAACSLILALRRERGEVLLANGFSFLQRPDVVAVHFLHGSWLRSPRHGSRVRSRLRRFYYWCYDRLHAQLDGLALKRGRYIVAVSTSVRRDLERLGIPGQVISVISNGVDTDEFSAGDAERDRFGLSRDKVVALFAGDLRSPRKNLETVLQALPQVPGLELAVAGWTSRSPYPALVKRLGLECRVRFLGYQANMPALLRSVDFVIFPSHYDPFGLVALEACATARPVIVSAAAGISTILDESCALRLDRSDDVEALTAAMRCLVAFPQLRRSMGEAGRPIAMQYRWGALAAHWLDLIEQVASVPEALCQPQAALEKCD